MNQKGTPMLKQILSYVTLPMLLLLGDSAGNSAPLKELAPNVPAVVPGPDVIMGDLPSLIQAGSDGTQVGLAMATDICNNGNVQVNWFRLPETDHPVIPQNLYRMSGGGTNDERFEQIGQSWVKHQFFPLQQNACGFGCTSSPDAAHLGVGCSTPDSASLNGSQPGLGSRAWVNPFTGIFPSMASSHTGHTHSGTAHRLLVEGSDLDTTQNPGATYYAEAQLVTPYEYAWCQANPGECNMHNNVSYRQFTVVGTTSFSFTALGDTVTMTPAINAWPGATIQTIEPEPGVDGRAFVAYKVTGPFGVENRWHYEYAIYNQSLDRAIRSFSVPGGCGMGTPTNLEFHAPLNHPGFANDGTVGDAGYSNAPWSMGGSSAAASWFAETFAQNPNANALRWGTLYNFRFDTGTPPTATNATIGFFKTGTPITVAVLGPSTECQPSPAPSSTPTPSPTAPPTPTPGVCGFEYLKESFDGVTAPDLPEGWVSSFTPGPADCTPTGTCPFGTNWTTNTAFFTTPPNSAFHDAPSCVTDSSLYSPAFFVFNAFSGASLYFDQTYDLPSGLDGAVLEISINGGPFIDFIAAGGSFPLGGGYNGTISAGTHSPIAGRPAWTGNSGGNSPANAIMPSVPNNSSVILRFRLATDCSGAGAGWHIDRINAYYLVPCPSPTPTPPTTTPTPTPTATPTPPPSTPTPTPTTPTPSPTTTPSPAQALNLSTRVRVQTGDNVGIGGFIITGSASKQLLLRGIGPSLVASGITDALANPTLDLRDSAGVRILANNDWRDDPAQEALIEATGIPPTNDLEAAIVQTLNPGTYTVILRGMGMTSGVGLVEIYDLDQGVDAKLANLSTRALVSTGDNIVIAGFILGGSGNDRIVVRGIGPSLTAFGVPDALPDPTLELRDSNGGLLVANNDWQDDPDQAAELTAAGLAPANNLESGIATIVAPGLYTALLAGTNNGTGVGVVEVYDRGP